MTRDLTLQHAAQAIAANALEPAARLLREHLQRRPDDIDAAVMLADVQVRRGRADRAEATLRRAIAIAAEAWPARQALARLLSSIGRIGEALELSHALHREAGNEPEILHLLAANLNMMGEQEEAASIYAELVRRTPEDAYAWTGYATMLRMLGRTEEAIDAFRRALEAAPSHGEAYWGLADLKTHRFSDADVARMRKLAQQSDLPALERSNILYALGKAMEDAGDADEAFRCYAAGAALRASPNPDPARVEAFVDRAERIVTRDFIAARADWGCLEADPIFIVGLPRSGSTLVEQIFASHSQVEPTMELPDLHVIARDLCDPEARARGGDYLDILPNLDAPALRKAGEAYLASTRRRRKTSRPFFVDKQPSNWAHSALIHLILPNAKIVDVRRHPMACGWSCFKQNFVTGQSFTYDLAQFAHYYSNYVRFMRHIDEAAPGCVHRVNYEHLVTDPDRRVRALLDHCGLAFESACLAPHETQRAVKTSSSEQVRQPISASGLDTWRAYETHLQPLKDALGDVLGAYPEAPR